MMAAKERIVVVSMNAQIRYAVKGLIDMRCSNEKEREYQDVLSATAERYQNVWYERRETKCGFNVGKQNVLLQTSYTCVPLQATHMVPNLPSIIVSRAVADGLNTNDHRIAGFSSYS